MQRTRNIRKKPEALDDDTSAPDSTEIKLRQPKKLSVIPSTQQEGFRQLLGAVQDRVYMEPFEVEESASDEDLLLKKRAEMARARRDAARQSGLEDGFVAVEEPSVGPLEMIADTGVDEEVFEDNRGRTIRFGLGSAGLDVADHDLVLEDDESRQWEMDQIQKGMASAGIKADREQRQVVKELGKEAKPVEKTELVDFGSLDLILTEIIQQTDQLEHVIANYQSELNSFHHEVNVVKQASAENAEAATVAAEKAAFHAEISEFISNFSQFSLEAAKLMDSEDRDPSQIDAFFDDALTEYSSIHSILAKLTQWKQIYPAEYADSFADHQLPFLLEIFVQRQLFAHDLLKPQGSLANLVNRLLDGADVPPQLMARLVEEVYMPRIFTKIAAKYDPGDTEQTVIVKNFLTDMSSHVSGNSRSIDTLKFVFSDIFRDAKSSCEPGSSRLQLILQNQSFLGIN